MRVPLLVHTDGHSVLVIEHIPGHLVDADDRAALHSRLEELPPLWQANHGDPLPGATPRVAAIVDLRTAQAYALEGSVTDCRRALDSAFDRLGDGPSSSGEPGWCYWLDEAQAHSMAGFCYLRMADWNQPDQSPDLSPPIRRIAERHGKLVHQLLRARSR